jgi:hypothetical protein
MLRDVAASAASLILPFLKGSADAADDAAAWVIKIRDQKKRNRHHDWQDKQEKFSALP